ncbi:MAG: PD-(D/E)XK nuclease domain-containing protein, partial [Gammaproteobacteria bacterium]|nr:PD-(D/E)XK nuclease domain-containing protein [Gammaproteobacteria bacterium]
MEREVSPLELEGLTVDARQLSKFDVDDIGIDALLFQTGYLTIAAKERRGPRTLYTLDYPNLEVRQSLSDGLLRYVTGRREAAADQGDELGRLLAANDFDGFADQLRSFFAGIPYQWQGGNSPARYEAWYAGMLCACFRTIGLDLRVEESSGRGRADMVALHGGQVFVFEFKMAATEGGGDAVAQQAIGQMREKGYAEKYRDRGEPVHLVGVAFSREGRNLAAVKVAAA